ncbi:MAG: hypothetical protein DHS20C16_00740 [Phycisphaerae bacterium]|nr:MAG: hypothetical protein DHS20C16_00740 [Phycisphaerae bacterium]
MVAILGDSNVKIECNVRDKRQFKRASGDWENDDWATGDWATGDWATGDWETGSWA